MYVQVDSNETAQDISRKQNNLPIVKNVNNFFYCSCKLEIMSCFFANCHGI